MSSSVNTGPATTENKQPVRRKRKVKAGVVTSDKMMKTVTVQVARLVLHPFYKKYIKKTSKYLAHDEEGKCRVGDKIEIVETRPLSRLKRWRVRKILEKAG